MFLMMFRVTQSYFRIALTLSSDKGRTLGTQRIHQELLEHLMQFYQGRWGGGRWFQQKSIDMSKRMYFQNLNEQIRVGGAKNVVYDNTNHRGSRMVFLIMSSIVNLKEHQNVDDDHDTFVERFHEDVIDWRWHQVKGMMKQKVIQTTCMTQTWNQACCSRKYDMTRKIDESLGHHRKLCSRKKDQVAQLKSCTIMI